MTSEVIDNAPPHSQDTFMRVFQIEQLRDSMGIVERETPTPSPGPSEILVRVRAMSLNKRDLFILQGTYPIAAKPGVVALSDGAGEVVAVGDRVTRFRVGDRVAGNYFPRWKSGPIEPDVFDQLGCTLDGMLTELAILHEEWAVRIPDGLSWEEAATLPCAAVTAWNSLVGPVPVLAGQTVLTLGTGGVSLFSLQFAKALGARVIITTSRDQKTDRLKELGADVVINYAENPEWGKAVRDATGGRGVDLVVETMGADTIEQSMRAVALHGQIMLLIARGTQKSHIEISAQAYGATTATLRRLFVGSRSSFEAMNRAIEVTRLKPQIDRVFPFSEAPQALNYYRSGKPFGKVVVAGV
jgi:NADPH:quinone reductase-like Zn-dependent oxidoreductase